MTNISMDSFQMGLKPLSAEKVTDKDYKEDFIRLRKFLPIAFVFNLTPES